MPYRTLKTCCLAAIAFWSISHQSRPEPAKTRLLFPREFPELPVQVRDDLQKMGCQIPQNTASNQPNNVVRGAFAKAGQTDWAALCAHGGRMRVVVIWGGRGRCSAEPSDTTDPIANVWSQQQDNAFEVFVSRAPRSRILNFREFFGDGHKNQITHDGIEYGGGNASVIYYCDATKWLHLQGDD